MKKIEPLILGVFYRISNTTYRVFSIDNYTLGTLSFILALCASVVLGYAVYHTDFHDHDPKMVVARQQVAVFAPMCFGILLITTLIYRKSLRSVLSLQHDLEKQEFDTQRIFGTMLRWGPVMYVLLTLVLAAFGLSKWWSMGDVCLGGIGMWFYSSKPPDMNLRMNKWASKERERLRS